MAPYCLLLHQQPIHHLLLLQRLPRLQLLFKPLHQLGTSGLSTTGVLGRMTGPLQHRDRLLHLFSRLLCLSSSLLPLYSRLLLLSSSHRCP